MGAIDGKKLTSVACPLCGLFSSKRLTALARHFEIEHGKTDKEVWDLVHGGSPTCACGCGGAVRWNGWNKGYSSVVNGHNGSIYAVHTEEEAKRISQKRSASLTGKTSWAKGLRKENDERVSARAAATSKGRKTAFERGDIKAWNQGLTKENDERMSRLANTLKEAYASGEVRPWAEGLSKDNDPRVAAMSTSVALALRQKSIRDKLDSMKRLSHEEVRRRIEGSGHLEVVEGLSSYVNDASKVIVARCKKCGDTFQGSLRTLGKGRCFNCAPGGSAAQEEVSRFVEGLGLSVKRNDRRTINMELDVLIEDKNVAIEYNGLYWHCHVNKSPSYHNNKSKEAKSQGVSVVHVFEDEWRDKRPVVESIIRAKLGLCIQKFDARKCTVSEMTPKERTSFFDKNHLDGDVRADTAWCLKLNGEIVYAMSLRRPFHKKHKDSLEIARCCPVINASVRGGLSRLVAAGIAYCRSQGKKSIITYVDTRLGGTGNGYETAGFKKQGMTVPRWWWTDMTSRFNRFKFKADSSRGMSEADVAAEAGVVKIWGCENVVYTLDL